jgi:hypothetical protein
MSPGIERKHSMRKYLTMKGQQQFNGGAAGNGYWQPSHRSAPLRLKESERSGRSATCSIEAHQL